ncbi:unnamed protein product [Moneuplotes crassus]|uniref:Uncharacterized protein n=1 Tax=Euplotes crassus TaxID=5936 RepID=A0AAD1UHM6_EUPCR|nr:unnamed protein product [Moneuplotes crassus]
MEDRRTKRYKEFLKVGINSPKQKCEQFMVKLRQKARKNRFYDTRKVRYLNKSTEPDYSALWKSGDFIQRIMSIEEEMRAIDDEEFLIKAYEMISCGLYQESYTVISKTLNPEFILNVVKDYKSSSGALYEAITSLMINLTSLVLSSDIQKSLVDTGLADYLLSKLNQWARPEDLNTNCKRELDIIQNLCFDKITKRYFLQNNILETLVKVIDQQVKCEANELRILGILKDLICKSNQITKTQIKSLIPFLYGTMINSDVNTDNKTLALACFIKIITLKDMGEEIVQTYPMFLEYIMYLADLSDFEASKVALTIACACTAHEKHAKELYELGLLKHLFCLKFTTELVAIQNLTQIVPETEWLEEHNIEILIQLTNLYTHFSDKEWLIQVSETLRCFILLENDDITQFLKEVGFIYKIKNAFENEKDIEVLKSLLSVTYHFIYSFTEEQESQFIESGLGDLVEDLYEHTCNADLQVLCRSIFNVATQE